MFRKILVPVDFTEKNEAALDSAVQIAGGGEQEGSEVTLLHVVEIIEHIDFKEMSDFYRGLENRASASCSPWRRGSRRRG